MQPTSSAAPKSQGHAPVSMLPLERRAHRISPLRFRTPKKIPVTSLILSAMEQIDTFPFSTWVRLLRETIHDRRSELMIHSPSGGIQELREAICQYLYQFRGMKVTPEQVVVGAGTGISTAS